MSEVSRSVCQRRVSTLAIAPKLVTSWKRQGDRMVSSHFARDCSHVIAEQAFEGLVCGEGHSDRVGLESALARTLSPQVQGSQ